jgi:hypothetical protein
MDLWKDNEGLARVFRAGDKYKRRGWAFAFPFFFFFFFFLLLLLFFAAIFLIFGCPFGRTRDSSCW